MHQNTFLKTYISKHFDRYKQQVIPVSSDKEAMAINTQDAVILFHAMWSGPSLVNLRQILCLLNNLNPSSTKVYFIDIDQVNTLIITSLLGNISHGWGEAALYKKGKIVARHYAQEDIKTFMEHLKKHIA